MAENTGRFIQVVVKSLRVHHLELGHPGRSPGDERVAVPTEDPRHLRPAGLGQEVQLAG